jgi:hypothetical protein
VAATSAADPDGMNVNVISTVLVAGVLLAGCGSDRESGSVALDTTTTTAARPATTPATTAPPTSPTTRAPATTTTALPEDLTGFQTDPFRHEHPVAVPPVPRVVGIRVGRHTGFDRVVFDIDGPLPGAVAVRFVDRVVADGSGQPVAVAGKAFLQVRFEGAQAHDDQGRATLATRTEANLPAVEEVVLAGDFEGYVTVALGLTAAAPFRVLELTGPTRVVVDVRTP